jgi:hypothetical protein
LTSWRGRRPEDFAQRASPKYEFGSRTSRERV